MSETETFLLGDYAYCQHGYLGHIEHIEYVEGRALYSGYGFGKKWSSVRPTRNGKTRLQLRNEYLERLNNAVL